MDSTLKCYVGKVRSSKSGDDFIMQLDLGISELSTIKRVRLKNVKTPHRDEDHNAAEDVKNWAHTQLILSQAIIVEVLKEHPNGVLVCNVHYVPSGEVAGKYVSMNQQLIEKGYGYVA